MSSGNTRFVCIFRTLKLHGTISRSYQFMIVLRYFCESTSSSPGSYFMVPLYSHRFCLQLHAPYLNIKGKRETIDPQLSLQVLQREHKRDHIHFLTVTTQWARRPIQCLKAVLRVVADIARHTNTVKIATRCIWDMILHRPLWGHSVWWRWSSFLHHLQHWPSRQTRMQRISSSHLKTKLCTCMQHL